MRRRFLRSVHLERDFYAADALAGYAPTPAALSALERVSAGVRQASARAVTVTGPYGTGKSAFALLLAKVLGLPPVGDAGLRAETAGRSPELAERLFGEADGGVSAGFWPVLMTGGREPLTGAMARALFRSLDHLAAYFGEEVAGAVRAGLPAPGESSGWTVREVTALYEAASRVLMAAVPGCRGVLLIGDEMGKFLEYAALHPEQGDLQALQELAEAASRSALHPIVFVTILHQAFEEYAHRLGPTQRAEWQKVQGRFADVPFSDPPEETVRLIGRTLERELPRAREKDIAAWGKGTAEFFVRHRLLPRGMVAKDFAGVVAGAFPLHPLTLLLLPPLFRRYGQSERSLFSFLSSEEPHSFSEFLARTVWEDSGFAPLLRVDALYDYVAATMSETLYAHPGSGKPWSQTQEAVYRAGERSPLESRVVKVVGLLHLLGEQSRLLPTREVVRYALCDGTVDEAMVDAALDSLQTATVLTYRQFRRAYRPYEGSDVDVEARVREARQELADRVDAAQTAAKLSATPPMVARRHSFRTGTLRFFDVRIVRPDTLRENVVVPDDSDGLLLLCLTSDITEQRVLAGEIAAVSAGADNIVFGLTVESEALHEAARAVEALWWVRETVEELRGDTVAEREVRERLADAESAFLSEWDRLLRPGGDVEWESESLWFYQGEAREVASSQALQRLVSLACDTAYHQTPCLRNELVNRRQLSSIAAAARRTLIEGMIERRDLRHLGIEGFPAERTMYATLLENTGMHRSVDGGETWELGPPTAEPALNIIWQEIERLLFSGELEARPLTEFNALLRARPYGLAEGVIPVLLCAALLYWEDAVLIYDDEGLITDLDTATFERMIKRPENYRLLGVRVTGERLLVVERFAQGLLKAGEEPTIVNVVRALFRNISRLPAFTLSTRTLSPEARSLRDTLKEARGSDQLLFAQFPWLFGARPFIAEGGDRANVELFFDRFNPSLQAIFGAYDELLARLRGEICAVFGVENPEEMRARAAFLRPHVTDPRLVGFVQRTSESTQDERKWLESVASVLVNRPPFAWTDNDETRFQNGLAALVSAFRDAELLAFARVEIGSPANKHTGFRLSVAEEGGVEHARIVVVPKSAEDVVFRLTEEVSERFKTLLLTQPENVRIAVVGRVAEAVLKNDLP